MTIIDRYWGNPSAEIAGYLHRYRDSVRVLPVDELIARPTGYLNAKEEFGSEHEIYCYIRLYQMLDAGRARQLEPQLRRAVASRNRSRGLGELRAPACPLR